MVPRRAREPRGVHPARLDRRRRRERRRRAFEPREIDLSALDDVLGADPVAPDPLGASYDDDDVEVLEVPIVWMRRPGADPGARQGGGLVAGALSGPSPPATSTPPSPSASPTAPPIPTGARGEGGRPGLCVDTAYTTNFILPQVAYGLDMQIVGVAPAGTGATGAIGGGQEMLLGSAKLGGNRDDVDVAITGLSAAVIPVPAPNTAGILGRSFLDCFGAVEFDWSEEKTGATCFHESYDFDEGEYEEEFGAETFDARELACGLLAVDMTLNGVTMPALVDTGALDHRQSRRRARRGNRREWFRRRGVRPGKSAAVPPGVGDKLKEGRERALTEG